MENSWRIILILILILASLDSARALMPVDWQTPASWPLWPTIIFCRGGSVPNRRDPSFSSTLRAFCFSPSPASFYTGKNCPWGSVKIGVKMVGMSLRSVALELTNLNHVVCVFGGRGWGPLQILRKAVFWNSWPYVRVHPICPMGLVPKFLDLAP